MSPLGRVSITSLPFQLLYTQVTCVRNTWTGPVPCHLLMLLKSGHLENNLKAFFHIIQPRRSIKGVWPLTSPTQISCFYSKSILITYSMSTLKKNRFSFARYQAPPLSSKVHVTQQTDSGPVYETRPSPAQCIFMRLRVWSMITP